MSSRGSMAGKVATMPTVDNWRALVERLQTEADLCRNEGAEDIAALLDEAVTGLQGMASDFQNCKELIWALARELKCLPSTFSDANGHVLKAAIALNAERDRLAAEVQALREDAERSGIREAARYIKRKADDYADTFGATDPDTGAFEFKREPQQDHFQTLDELADEIEQLAARGKPAQHCTYPDCRCPFDAPSDPSWCAKGLPRAGAGVDRP